MTPMISFFSLITDIPEKIGDYHFLGMQQLESGDIQLGFEGGVSGSISVTLYRREKMAVEGERFDNLLLEEFNNSIQEFFETQQGERELRYFENNGGMDEESAFARAVFTHDQKIVMRDGSINWREESVQLFLRSEGGFYNKLLITYEVCPDYLIYKILMDFLLEWNALISALKSKSYMLN